MHSTRLIAAVFLDRIIGREIRGCGKSYPGITGYHAAERQSIADWWQSFAASEKVSLGWFLHPLGMGLRKLPCCPGAETRPPPKISPGDWSSETEPSHCALQVDGWGGEMGRLKQCCQSRCTHSKHWVLLNYWLLIMKTRAKNSCSGGVASSKMTKTKNRGQWSGAGSTALTLKSSRETWLI